MLQSDVIFGLAGFLFALLLGPPDLDRIGLTPLIRKRMPVKLAQRPLKDPRIVPWFLPYEEYVQSYKEYFRRLARDPEVIFKPTMICMHYTVTPTAQEVWDSFARPSRLDTGDYGFMDGQVSVHFMIDKDGTIYQLLPTDWRCTGAYGVNHVALSIEMVASDENDLLSRPQQVYASFCLVKWLMKRHKIPLEKVVSHFEVSCGKLFVKEYTDYADSKWPSCYPPQFFRFDPGMTYMGWLRRRLR